MTSLFPFKPTTSEQVPVSVPRPPFDPAFKFAEHFAGLSESLEIETLRSSLSSMNAGGIVERFPYLEHKEFTAPAIKGLGDQPITLSVFQSNISKDAKKSVLFYIHGGGQVSGNRFSGLDLIISAFSDLDPVFVTVEYRVAPEHRSPAGAYDSYAGLAYVADHAVEWGIDPSKIVVYGVSGGAAPAASVAKLSRMRQYPNICAQVLSTPMLDDRNTSVSAKQFEHGTLWCGVINRMAWDLVLGAERGNPDVDELSSPARSVDLSGLPPAYIDVGECEVFRDEAVAYASQLWKYGGTAELHVWPGSYHGAFLLEADVPVSQSALNAQKDFLRRLLS
ncbi:hypothetical protein Plec18167_009650 [Paecilomyces lecythidis]|uniref:Alpha/beta hydrolase fold-3 domain-containing protein n=1 Tax=Paecilomyces lecythidis TaxID=3004212 RepID=A0ABR3WMS2_9EURO